MEGEAPSLDALLNEYFAGRVVRKDLTKQVKEGGNVPVHVVDSNQFSTGRAPECAQNAGYSPSP